VRDVVSIRQCPVVLRNMFCMRVAPCARHGMYQNCSAKFPAAIVYGCRLNVRITGRRMEEDNRKVDAYDEQCDVGGSR
jgi:hypothetical protein